MASGHELRLPEKLLLIGRQNSNEHRFRRAVAKKAAMLDTANSEGIVILHGIGCMHVSMYVMVNTLWVCCRLPPYQGCCQRSPSAAIFQDKLFRKLPNSRD